MDYPLVRAHTYFSEISKCGASLFANKHIRASLNYSTTCISTMICFISFSGRTRADIISQRLFFITLKLMLRYEYY